MVQSKDKPCCPQEAVSCHFGLVKGPSGTSGLAPRTDRAGGGIGKELCSNKPPSDFRWQGSGRCHLSSEAPGVQEDALSKMTCTVGGETHLECLC